MGIHGREIAAIDGMTGTREEGTSITDVATTIITINEGVVKRTILRLHDPLQTRDNTLQNLSRNRLRTNPQRPKLGLMLGLTLELKKRTLKKSQVKPTQSSPGS